MLGSSISAFAFPLVAAVTLHATAGQMGLLRAIEEVPAVLFGLLVGSWVDRVSRRRLLITLDLCAAALTAAIPIASLLGLLRLELLYALGALFGVLGGSGGRPGTPTSHRSWLGIVSSTPTARSCSPSPRAGSWARASGAFWSSS
jgi:MFS family permease